MKKAILFCQVMFYVVFDDEREKGKGPDFAKLERSNEDSSARYIAH